jgi:hypothetical protein
MNGRARKSWFSKLAALAAGISLLGALPPAARGQTPDECPTVMPVADLEVGMTGTGLTVARGTEPESFDVEILGVLPNAILPGRDLIIVDTAGAVIDEAGGVWFGMSGSPVYVTDDGVSKLVGAVSFGFSFGPSSIAGVTPAEDMMAVLDYGSRFDARSLTAEPRKVRLSKTMRARIARATGTSTDEVGSSLTRLKLPVSISGLDQRGLNRIARRLEARGVRAVPFAGGSAELGQTADPSEIFPGSNFAAAISYGDLTFAGIGTTTFVCRGAAMAFGHPFFFEGATSMGANAATALTIVDDPVFSPYKLATVGGQVGTLDQDRLAGVRANLGGTVTAIPVTSDMIALNTGRSRSGRTDVTTSEFAAFLAPFHVYLNVIATMDQFGEGSSEFEWTVTGTREDGSTWQLSRSNMASDNFDIALDRKSVV